MLTNITTDSIFSLCSEMTSWKREANVWRKVSLDGSTKSIDSSRSNNTGTGTTLATESVDMDVDDIPDQSKGLLGMSRLQHISGDDINIQIDSIVDKIDSSPLIPCDSTSQSQSLKVDKFATKNTIYFHELYHSRMLPSGSAVYTSSGALVNDGITAIIHAATGSRLGRLIKDESTGRKLWDKRFEPSLQSVGMSIVNCMNLASQFGHKRIAIPFIGGSIFLKRIGSSSESLASEIVRTVLHNRNNLHVSFIAFSPTDKDIFNSCLNHMSDTDTLGVSVVLGDITKFSTHGCDVIVNCSNMELSFGGGLSKAIAEAVKCADVENEAHSLIDEYHRARLNLSDA